MRKPQIIAYFTQVFFFVTHIIITKWAFATSIDLIYAMKQFKNTKNTATDANRLYNNRRASKIPNFKTQNAEVTKSHNLPSNEKTVLKNN